MCSLTSANALTFVSSLPLLVHVHGTPVRPPSTHAAQLLLGSRNRYAGDRLCAAVRSHGGLFPRFHDGPVHGRGVLDGFPARGAHRAVGHRYVRTCAVLLLLLLYAHGRGVFFLFFRSSSAVSVRLLRVGSPL